MAFKYPFSFGLTIIAFASALVLKPEKNTARSVERPVKQPVPSIEMSRIRLDDMVIKGDGAHIEEFAGFLYNYMASDNPKPERVSDAIGWYSKYKADPKVMHLFIKSFTFIAGAKPVPDSAQVSGGGGATKVSEQKNPPVVGPDADITAAREKFHSDPQIKKDFVYQDMNRQILSTLDSAIKQGFVPDERFWVEWRNCFSASPTATNIALSKFLSEFTQTAGINFSAGPTR